MVTFNEAMETAQAFCLRPNCKNENSGFFTNLRVDRDTIPEGWYAYDIREAEGHLCTIENFVYVNHGGTFLTQKKIVFPNSDNCMNLKGRGGYTFC